MQVEIKQLNNIDIKKAVQILTETFEDDKGMLVLFKKNDTEYKQKLQFWFFTTLKLQMKNNQLVLGAYQEDELIGIAVISHTSFKPSFLSIIQWTFSILFSCGYGTVLKTASHDQKRKKYYTKEHQLILEFIAVNPTQQGKGVGKELFSNIHQYAKNANESVWLETTREINTKIFQKMNYNLIHEKSETGVDYWIMTNEKAVSTT
jgi:GNAT superfamily N-acetyltransferase